MANDPISRINKEREIYDHGINLSLKYKLLLESLNNGPAINRCIAITHDLMSACNGKESLEIGSGSWASWIDFSRYHPNKLVAINISRKELQSGIDYYEMLTPDFLIDFRIMDAHSLEFPDFSFDFVYGASILHHLDIDVAIKEIWRVLKPQGAILFLEPLIYNPIAKVVRFLTPNYRTLDEKPLGYHELQLINHYFDIQYYYFQFLEPIFTIISFFIFDNPVNKITRLADPG